MSPQISVVLPTFNSARYLAGAIESVRAQGWPDLEILVVDDGSTDDTLATVARLAGPDLRLLRQENQGPAAARNAGIAAATGEWIAFQDADDLWLPGKLDSQMLGLMEHPDCGFSFTDTLARDMAGFDWIQRPLQCSIDTLECLLLGPQFASGSVVAKRRLFQQVGFFDTSLRTGEDWDMWLRLAAVSPGLYIPKVLFFARIWDATGKYPIDLFQRANLRVLERIFTMEGAARYRPEILSSRRRVYAWHYAVLAKSNLYRGRLFGFINLSCRSVWSHPAGIYFLASRWRRIKHRPQLVLP